MHVVKLYPKLQAASVQFAKLDNGTLSFKAPVASRTVVAPGTRFEKMKVEINLL